MSASRVIRVQVLDSSDIVLLHSQSDGPSPLDISLTGTDEEAAFQGHIRQSTHQKLKSQTASASGDEWTAILGAILGPVRDAFPHNDAVGNEVVAKVDREKITLVVRKNVQGIRQRLGEIVLPRNDLVEIRLFEWTAQAVSAANKLQGTLADLQTEVQNQRQTVTNLQTLLDDLTAARAEDEDTLMQKFVRLLNAKKLKIRDQQRLLAHAKIDPDAAATVQSMRETTRRRRAHDSGPLKRRIDEESSDDERKDSSADDDGSDRVETPEHSESSSTPEDQLDDLLLGPSEHSSAPQPSSSAHVAIDGDDDDDDDDDDTDDEL